MTDGHREWRIQLFKKDTEGWSGTPAPFWKDSREFGLRMFGIQLIQFKTLVKVNDVLQEVLETDVTGKEVKDRVKMVEGGKGVPERRGRFIKKIKQ